MKILFVCKANSERSPTAEMVFRDVLGWETLSAGTSSDAVTPLRRELIEWADRVVVMESIHMERVVELCARAKGREYMR